jgi:hypothetical protein
MSIIEIILSSNTAYVLLLYLISAKVQFRRFKETILHILTKNVILVLHILVCTKWIVYLDLWMKHWISARVTKGWCLWIYSQRLLNGNQWNFTGKLSTMSRCADYFQNFQNGHRCHGNGQNAKKLKNTKMIIAGYSPSRNWWNLIGTTSTSSVTR